MNELILTILQKFVVYLSFRCLLFDWNLVYLLLVHVNTLQCKVNKEASREIY